MLNQSVRKPYNVLVFPGSSEIGLEIYKALRYCKDIRLFSVGTKGGHAPFIFTRNFEIPSIYEEGWIDALNKIIDEQKIDYIFPAYDDIIVALIENAAYIHANIVTSPEETCLITRSKSKTYQLFKGKLPVPRIYSDVNEVTQYPIFIKPDKGQGSQGTAIVRTRQQLEFYLRERRDLLILEYLSETEYTIDCFSDRERGLLFCKGRSRNRTKNGISMNSTGVEHSVFYEYARIIERYLVFHGAWFFQLKQNSNGDFVLLEIAPRIAGTMAFYRVQGVNFPLLSIYEQQRIPIQLLTNEFNVEIDRALINRYKIDLQFECVYVDLDDLILFNDQINIDIIRFLYQCINKKIQLVLLTKHASDLTETLKQHRITGIFDEVIHISRDSAKADYITNPKSIFIDDSFSERKAVQNRCNIPTFDSSMIEQLIDERG